MGSLGALAIAYVLSQFYRSFLAVLAPSLGRDLGATPADLSTAAGLWFVAFALMQIPVGMALDSIGPRRTVALLLGGAGGGGALLLALAPGPGAVIAAMALIGIGCSPVLVSSYYLIARLHPPARFATLAAAMIGVGSLGNLAGAAPLAAAVEAFGWRPSLAGLAALTALVATALFLVLRDPPRQSAPGGGGVLAGYRRILSIGALWLIFPAMLTNYAPAVGVRGLWAGPYLAEIHGLDTAGIGTVTLAMALAMIAGNFAYGPLDRLLGTRKRVVLGGNALAALACLWLALNPGAGLAAAGAAFALLGFFGASFAVIVAHGRSFLPADLTGRGITLLNFFGIGGVGLAQLATGQLHAATGGGGPATWSALFGFYAALLLAGLVPYAFARDSTD